MAVLSLRRRLSLLSLGLVPTLAACSLLLDFNKLQGGHRASPDAGTGGSIASAGSAGATSGAGEAGATGACDTAQCDDQDPCTIDHCDAASALRCTHTYSAGLGLEKDWPPIVADAAYRVTLTAGSDAFYFSTFSQTAGASDVEIFRLGENDDAYTSLKKLSSVAVITGQPASVAGLAVDTSGALGERLHALVAVKGVGGNIGVWQLIADAKGQFAVPTKVGDSYSDALPYNYPVARSLNGAVNGAWINADGSISVLPAGAATPKAFGSPSLAASTLTLVGTDANQPAVVFSGKTNGVYLETAGGNRAPMPECQTAAGGYQSMGAMALAGHNGVWFASWTKYGAGFLTTETHVLVCANGGCLPDTTTACKASDARNDQRNSVNEDVHVPGDPAEQSYGVIVSPGVSSSADGGPLSASIVALLVRLTSPLDKSGTSTAIGDPLTLSSQATAAPDFAGPDLPALAVLPGTQVKVAISWIQPAAGGSGGEELHLQRYRLCPPK